MRQGWLLCYPLTMQPARILRLLATNYIFTEVSPDVFVNNRLSSVLDTGRSVEELLERFVPGTVTAGNESTMASPESKHIGTLGLTSIIEHAYGLSIGLSCPDPDISPQPRRRFQELCLSDWVYPRP